MPDGHQLQPVAFTFPARSSAGASMRAQSFVLVSPSRKGSGLPYVLAALVCLFASSQSAVAQVPWRICEVYSNLDGSSQFIQLCGSSDELSGREQTLFGRTLVASSEAVAHSFVFPLDRTPYYDSHRLLVATQGFADLNLIKPDFVVPNGFLPIPNGSISLAGHDSASYAALPTDGSHAIEADLESRPIDGGPSTAITLATASNFEWQSYGFAGRRNDDIADGRWDTTGSLGQVRSGHTATLLPSGKVLIVGGQGGTSPPYDLDTTELFDPATGRWSAAGNLHGFKSGHSATLLPSGKVLVVGQAANGTASAELFDPVTGTWNVIDGPSGVWRDHTATLLRTGKVLLAGGWGTPYSSYYRAVLYDPATGSWGNTGSLNVPRGAAHQATLMQDGSVLVTGGSSDPDFATALHSTESYDPAAGRWSRVGSLHIPRAGEPATLLPDGRVLVGGGIAELYDPATRKWSIAEPFAAADVAGHTVSLLADGVVLVAGGHRSNPGGAISYMDSAELYDPVSQTTRKTARLNTARFGHTATRLQDGSVLVVGGHALAATNEHILLDSAEVFKREGRGAAIGAGFTGYWFDPAQSGHGFAIEVVSGSPPQLLASWFTFAPQGGQSWIVGLGPIDGGLATLHATQSSGAGGRFPPNFDAANVRQADWGTLTFTFSDCNHGHVEWTSTVPGYGIGGMDLTRLTLPAGLTCPVQTTTSAPQ